MGGYPGLSGQGVNASSHIPIQGRQTERWHREEEACSQRQRGQWCHHKPRMLGATGAGRGRNASSLRASKGKYRSARGLILTP